VNSRLIAAFQPCSVNFVTDTNKYGIDRRIIEGGWRQYIAEEIEPELEWLSEVGRPRLLIHNPLMVRKGDVYQIDQWIHAQNAGLVTAKDFDAWRPIIDRAEVIFYVGTLHGDRDFDKRMAPMKLDDHMRRLLDSVAPFINVGGSVGFDYANDWPADSFEYRELDMCRAMIGGHGGRTYIEPIQHKDCPHLFHWASITEESLYQNRTDAWAAPLSKITGEIIRWASWPLNGWGSVEQNAKGLLPIFRSIVGDGHSACGATTWLRQWGMKASEVFE
jgi:hypothetical protein